MTDRMLDAIEKVCGKRISLPATVVCLTTKSSEDGNTIVPMFYLEEEEMMMTWAAMPCPGDESFIQLEVGRLWEGAPLVKPGTLVGIQFGTDENVKRAGTIDMSSIAAHAGEAVARALQQRIDIVQETISTSLTGTYGMGGST